jgi:hypothetical protein
MYSALRQWTAVDQRKYLHETMIGALPAGMTEDEVYAQMSMSQRASHAYTRGSLSSWGMTMDEWSLKSALANVGCEEAQQGVGTYTHAGEDADEYRPPTPHGFSSEARGAFKYDGGNVQYRHKRQQHQRHKHQNQNQQQYQQRQQNRAHPYLRTAAPQPRAHPQSSTHASPTQQYAVPHQYLHHGNHLPPAAGRRSNHQPTNGSPIPCKDHPAGPLDGFHNDTNARPGRYYSQLQSTPQPIAGPFDYLLSEQNRQLGRETESNRLSVRFTKQQAPIGTGRPGVKGVMD